VVLPHLFQQFFLVAVGMEEITEHLLLVQAAALVVEVFVQILVLLLLVALAMLVHILQ
jgi:hypothetical protein